MRSQNSTSPHEDRADIIAGCELNIQSLLMVFKFVRITCLPTSEQRRYSSAQHPLSLRCCHRGHDLGRSSRCCKDESSFPGAIFKGGLEMPSR